MTINHHRGFDCPCCAGANPDHSKVEFWDNGIKTIVWEATRGSSRTSSRPRSSLISRLDSGQYWLGLQGRITHPMHQTMGAPDQHHTTSHSLNEWYRGVHNGRFVVLMPADDIVELGLVNGQPVDGFSEWPAEPDRVLRGYRVGPAPPSRAAPRCTFPRPTCWCRATRSIGSAHTSTSKRVTIRVERGAMAVQGGRPVAV